jgi:multidrug transporter EmrE-like cation transporter
MVFIAITFTELVRPMQGEDFGYAILSGIGLMDLTVAGIIFRVSAGHRRAYGVISNTIQSHRINPGATRNTVHRLRFLGGP